MNLRELTNKVRKADGRPPIEEPIEASIDHLPIDSMIESLRDKALRNAQNGTNAAHVDFLNIYYGRITERQEHELLNVLYNKLSEVFTDTLELSISWMYDYDYDMEESYMVIDIEWWFSMSKDKNKTLYLIADSEIANADYSKIMENGFRNHEELIMLLENNGYINMTEVYEFLTGEDDYVFTKPEKDLRVIIKETPEVDE